MEPYWAHSSSDGTSTPRKRKKNSSNGVARTSRDPVFELMMCELLEREPVSKNGANVSSNGAKHAPVPQAIVTHQPGVVSSAEYAVSAAFPGGAPPRGCCSRLWQTCWFKSLVAALALIALVLVIALPVGLSRAAQGNAAAGRRMQPPQGALGPRLNTTGMSLVFADDFTSFDSSTWNYDIGDGSDYGLQSWGNNELQCYTSSSNNVDVIPHPDYPLDDGVLRIRPVYTAEPAVCINRNDQTTMRQWTSGKIDTKNKIAFTWSGQQVYKGTFQGRDWSSNTTRSTTGSAPSTGAATGGSRRRALLQQPAGPNANGTQADNSSSSSNSTTCGSVLVESRMKLPMAYGRWSALWMMPMPQPCPRSSLGASECGKYGSWPRSGEIDIVEQVNRDAEVLGTIHYAINGWHQFLGGKLALSEAEILGWNIYQLVWNCSSITWYVNTQQVYQVTKEQVGAANWPFDEPFFLILNTAIGGWLTGNVAPDTAQSRPMMVDYVRVYASPGGSN